MNKVFVVSLLFGLLLVSSVSIMLINSNSETNGEEDNFYYGPVPQGYNLQYYRLTGETKLNKEINK